MEPGFPEWDEYQSIVKSRLTCRRYPLKYENVETLFDAAEMAGGDPEALYKLCHLLLSIWKYAIFFQPKPEAFIELLQKNNYPGPVVKGILEAYSSETMAGVVESLASCSNSGIPHVISTDWTCRTIVSRSSIPSSDREVVLTLSTDKGVKQVQLSAKDLEKLYWTVNKVQASLDGLLER